MISIIGMRGANAFVEPLQDPIAHLIMRAFQRKTADFENITETQKIDILLNEIENFHDQLRYPFGKICMMQRNAESQDFTRQYYAIKELSFITEVIEDENFVRYLKETDGNFADAWAISKNKILEWHKEILSYELLKGDVITSTTFNYFRAIKRDDNYILEKNIECVKAVKYAWQMIWHKFLNAKTAFSHITENRDNMFSYRLTRFRPSLENERYFLLGINAQNNLRLWANLEKGLFKARPTTRKLKWVKTDLQTTDITPVWWLYACEDNNAIIQTDKNNNVEDRDDLSYDFSATTIY
jgi:hypothetical protein